MRSRPRVISGKTKDMAQEVRLNGVRYRWPKRPVVVVCIDGGDPAYFDRALKDGIIPNVARFMKNGFHSIADCVIPSFTCPERTSSTVILTESPMRMFSPNFLVRTSMIPRPPLRHRVVPPL